MDLSISRFDIREDRLPIDAPISEYRAWISRDREEKRRATQWRQVKRVGQIKRSRLRFAETFARPVGNAKITSRLPIGPIIFLVRHDPEFRAYNLSEIGRAPNTFVSASCPSGPGMILRGCSAYPTRSMRISMSWPGAKPGKLIW